MKTRYTHDYTIAFHEAAHAVTRIALGLSVKYIEISDPSTGREGYMETFDSRCFAHDVPAVIVASLASIPAERILRPRATTFELICSACADDWTDAEGMVRMLHGAEHAAVEIERYLRRAGKLVRKLAPVIHVVAAALVVRRHLGYIEILDLIPDDVQADGIAAKLERLGIVSGAA
jgi:hypothetical protein